MKKTLLSLITIIALGQFLAAQNVGIGTTTPANLLDVRGSEPAGAYLLNVRNAGAGSGIYSNIDNAPAATLTLQSAIKGETVNNIGVTGITNSGNGVAGFANTGSGVYGTSISGSAVEGYSTGNGIAGFFLAVDGPAGYFNSLNGKGLIVEKGNVGIGVTNPYNALEVYGTLMLNPTNFNDGSLRLRISATDSSNLMFANASFWALYSEAFDTRPNTGLWINKTANDLEPYDDNLTDLGTSIYRFKNVFAGNGTIQTSDARMKKNITPIKYGLSTVMKLRPVSYEWKNPKDESGTQIGFIAQEVEHVFPEAVVHSQISQQQIDNAKSAGKPIPAITDPYGMRYAELIPLLTKAIQEQQEKIEQLEKEIKSLKRQ